MTNNPPTHDDACPTCGSPAWDKRRHAFSYPGPKGECDDPFHDDAESEAERVEDSAERLFSVGGCTCTWDEDDSDGVVVKADPDCPAHALLAELAQERERAERAESLIRRYRRPFPDGGLNPAERRQAMHQRMVEAEAALTQERQLREEAERRRDEARDEFKRRAEPTSGFSRVYRQAMIHAASLLDSTPS